MYSREVNGLSYFSETDLLLIATLLVV